MSKTIRELTEDLLAAPSTCAELKEIAQAYLASIGTADEASNAPKFISALEESIMPIGGLIAFAESDMGKQIFGDDKAKAILAHAKDIEAAGAKYCDCAACAACEALLERKDEILK